MLSSGGWIQVVALNHLRRYLARRRREREAMNDSPVASEEETRT